MDYMSPRGVLALVYYDDLQYDGISDKQFTSEMKYTTYSKNIIVNVRFTMASSRDYVTGGKSFIFLWKMSYGSYGSLGSVSPVATFSGSKVIVFGLTRVPAKSQIAIS